MDKLLASKVEEVELTACCGEVTLKAEFGDGFVPLPEEEGG